ncbi:hypothetical protein OIU84_015427 [Salix udensis]|uniref:Uncharacterized protein n=1 Tax=Salix udensis TaxID=889485 RepID=A0AAD6NSJ7_9ROSI|nr:hypothetical protein OIU84_015427 [Salix udensis]
MIHGGRPEFPKYMMEGKPPSSSPTQSFLLSFPFPQLLPLKGSSKIIHPNGKGVRSPLFLTHHCISTLSGLSTEQEPCALLIPFNLSHHSPMSVLGNKQFNHDVFDILTLLISTCPLINPFVEIPAGNTWMANGNDENARQGFNYRSICYRARNKAPAKLTSKAIEEDTRIH